MESNSRPQARRQDVGSDAPELAYDVYSGSNGLEVAHDPRQGQLEANLDAQGPQVYKVMDYDKDGLQAVSGTDSNSGLTEKLADPRQNNHNSRARKRKRIWIASAVILAIVTLAAVLGGVLGSRAHNSTNEQAAPGATSSAGDNQPIPDGKRLKSDHGTWNATGITITPIEQSSASSDTRLCSCIFQDFQGRMQTLDFEFNLNDSTLAVQQSATLSIDAANGTGLTSHWWNDDKVVQVIYIAPNGTLSDVFFSNFPNGLPVPGNLSSHGWKAPIDNRAAMTSVTDYHGNMLTVFAGATDGRLHSYSFDYNRRIWNTEPTYNFPNSSAYGGASAVMAEPPANGSYTFNLYFTDSDGHVRSTIQSDIGRIDPNTNWPSGGPWSNDDVSSFQTLRNTSIALSIPAPYGHRGAYTEWLVFADGAGTLMSQSVLNETTPDQYSTGFGTSNKLLQQYSIMEGSDMEYLHLTQTLILYQSNGTSLTWTVMDSDGEGQNRSGSFVDSGKDAQGNQIWISA